MILAGGGFIGLELAENLRKLGMAVTIVQRPKQLMNPFDPDMAAFIHGEMRRNGVTLALGHTVEGFVEKDGGLDVLLQGSRPSTPTWGCWPLGYAGYPAGQGCGFGPGIKGSILVNDRMETSLPDIYAVGTQCR